MQLKFIYTNPDGTVGIVGSGRLEDLQRQFGPDFSLDDLRELIARKSIPPGATFEEMPIGWEPPSDREFRNAWRGNPTPESSEHTQEPKIHVDMPHARNILRDKFRRKRIQKLAELDVEYMRADESGDQQKKTEISERKQFLRDITGLPEIEAAKTPEELKSIRPLG